MKLNDIKSNILKRMDITELTPVQQQMATVGPDNSVKIIAPTGSGKTLAFTVAVLRNLPNKPSGVKALVIAPARELARQVGDVMRNAAGSEARVTVCYGGHPFIDEQRSLESSDPAIVVGTPGRLLDHINRRTLDVSGVTTLVIDEFDKSLELGFGAEMKRICRAVGPTSLLIVTSATELSEWPTYLPERFTTVIDTTGSGDSATKPSVDISLVTSYSRDKLDTLTQLLLTLGRGRTIVFANHRESVERIAARLRRDGFDNVTLSGALEQADRENALERFANGSSTVMVATDLAGRGLDISEVENIVHYHIPPTAEAWTHRNGRTARMGASGNVYVIASEGETLPEYVTWDREYIPNPEGLTPVRAPYTTLYFNLGKREKISRGDIVGFLLANTSLGSDDIGRISLRDHCALVAVAAPKAASALRECSASKIKNKRVKITILR